MTRCSAGAAVAEGPALAGLIAEVEAILCDAAARLRRPPPSRQLIGCALAAPRSPGGPWAVSLQPWSTPPPDVRAVQRSPPRATRR